MRRISFLIALVVTLWGISEMRPRAPERELAAEKPTFIAPSEKEIEKVEVKVSPRDSVKSSAPVFAFRAELNSYAELKTKVLPTDSERDARESLIKNAVFLSAVGDRLRQLPLLAIGEQDAALDLLIEASQKGDQEAARATILSVVEDSKVEDEALPEAVREQLAGIKAELLFHWTAFEPNQGAEVAKRLPGPVSRKIWSNVLAAQRSNLALSADEATSGR